MKKLISFLLFVCLLACPAYANNFDGNGNEQVNVVNSSIPVTGTFWQTTQPVSGTFWQSVQPVSGTFWQSVQPASQSGTWNLTNISGTVSLPTGAATSAKQPALGTAGTASSDVLTVQGITSMTPLKVDGSGVTQPVSGTFWQTTQPVSGTFWQSTQPTSISDGSLTTLGSKADAKSTATDTTSVSAMQVLKEISAMEQAPASRAVTNAGTFAVQSAQSGTWTVQPGNTANTTAWKVDGSSVTQPVSGTVTANQGGAPWSVGGNVASGASDSGNPVKVGGVYNSTPITLTAAQRGDIQLDANGYLKVNISAGSSAGGTSSTFGSTFPTTGTAIGASDGTNMKSLLVDGSQNLKVVKAIGNVKQAYNTAGTFTITLASLANGSSRQSTVIDNTSNLFLDSQVRVVVKTGASGVSSTGTISVYLIATNDGGTTYDDAGGASDAAITITNARLLGTFSAVANATSYTSPLYSVAQAAGGRLPQKWGIAVQNNSGAALDATAGNHKALYVEIYQTQN